MVQLVLCSKEKHPVRQFDSIRTFTRLVCFMIWGKWWIFQSSANIVLRIVMYPPKAWMLMDASKWYLEKFVMPGLGWDEHLVVYLSGKRCSKQPWHHDESQRFTLPPELTRHYLRFSEDKSRSTTIFDQCLKQGYSKLHWEGALQDVILNCGTFNTYPLHWVIL